MPSDKQEESGLRSPTPAAHDQAGGPPPRSPRKPRRTRSSRMQAAVHAAADSANDAGERLRDGTTEALAATRARIVANPVQAVLIAVAAGAVAALLLGIGRR